MRLQPGARDRDGYKHWAKKRRDYFQEPVQGLFAATKKIAFFAANDANNAKKLGFARVAGSFADFALFAAARVFRDVEQVLKRSRV